MSSILVFSIGFLAQGFFSARILVQWILSERAHRVLSPSAFWVCSVAGAWLLCLYGWLRGDFAIVLGQVLSYYVYLWNLRAKGLWQRIPWLVRCVLAITPLVVIVLMLNDLPGFVKRFFQHDGIPLWLVWFGSMGQVLFTFRFVYQWVCSRRLGESRLPAGFWWLSLAGSLSIVSYGILRHDPVLIIGQSFGLVAYVRNLCLLKKRSR